MQRPFKLRFSHLLFLLIPLFALPSCATNPVTGKKQFSIISEQKEIQMGQQYDPQVVAEMGIYDDPKLQAFLVEKGNEMAAQSERPNLPWTFRLVDNSVVNAFAVPGGFVYFTRGIMAHFNNEAQFAGVLGHEIGHVTARHTVQQQSRQTLGQIALIGGMIASPEIAAQGESLMQGMQMLFLKYGRDAESQSDQLGVRYSTAVGYDATEMAGFFGTLDRLSGGAENRAPSFSSTHPDPLDRERKVLEMAAERKAAQPGKNFEVGRESYLRRIDGMLYGEDPNAGYEENGAFYHPQLKFQFNIPRQWQLLNAPSQVQMVAPDQKAVMQMKLAQGTDPRAAAQEFIQGNNISVAQQSGNNINGLPAYTVIGTAQQQAQQGQRQQSPPIAVEASFISYGGNIYMIVGMAAEADFRRYQRDIEYTIQSFAQLTDQSKLNRQPERIKIVTNDRTQTIQQALIGQRIPQDRLQELSILNGMELNETMQKGMLYKSLSGGNIR
ncbi:M48 family metalloprotease [Neolewinella antarctica]|uniref:Zn-dependent protease n=1 Tax=Neolewinella antarctica TaxID=442734 RepID=A0ABX0XF74_9BACT|nr:M48 family metalloprotease [Neolewinella antarctica]NJC27886.1 putative Zn-dependent protease [Neolewinella antarctica]